MSNYYSSAVHPLTRKIEQALYMDNHFGRHIYGVKFEDGSIWRLEQLPKLPEPDPYTEPRP